MELTIRHRVPKNLTRQLYKLRCLYVPERQSISRKPCEPSDVRGGVPGATFSR